MTTRTVSLSHCPEVYGSEREMGKRNITYLAQDSIDKKDGPKIVLAMLLRLS